MAKKKKARDFIIPKDILVTAIHYPNNREGLLLRLHDGLCLILSRKLTQRVIRYSYLKQLREYRQKYRSTGNAIYLIWAFIDCIEWGGGQIPKWILRGLHEGFVNYFDSLGDITLDKAFGLKGWQRRDSALSAFTEYQKKARDEMFFVITRRAINRGYKVTEAIEYACEVVNSRMKKAGVDVKPLEYDTAIKIYYQKKMIP